LALVSGDLSQTLRGDETLQEKERAFYRLSKYLYQRERLRENTYFYFPSEDIEGDIINVFTALNTTISKMFGDNQNDIAKIISYYESNKEYNDFCVLATPSNEFAIFKSKIDESKFKKNLEENSGKLCSLIMDAITMTYESWYKQHKCFYSGLTNKLNRGKKQGEWKIKHLFAHNKFFKENIMHILESPDASEFIPMVARLGLFK